MNSFAYFTRNGAWSAALLLLGGLILGTAGCSSARVYSETDNAVSFSKYKTFALIENEKESKKPPLNPIAESNVEHAITQEMEKRGYKPDEKEPDLLVKYHFTVDTRSQKTSRPVYDRRPVAVVGGPFRPNYYVYSRPYVVGQSIRTVNFKEGTLAVELIDRRENRLIWRGWAEDALKEMGNLSETLPDITADIFKKFSGTASR